MPRAAVTFTALALCSTSMFAVAPLASSALAQPTRQPSAAEIAKRLQKLSVLGSVLYVAAHPDDENTSLLTYLANGKMVRAAYLSVTRGDGGQNLIGSEQGVALGVIRTQELLAARRTDGAEQMFTRARDFGYSKSVEESLQIWGDDEILADVVIAIRRFRPDLIITRFSPTGGGHGHHTASAQLAGRAFKLAADVAYQPPGQPKLAPWQARRLLVNRGGGEGESFRLDVGPYDPLLGLSYGEISAESRSMHKSQGFGSVRRRGPQMEGFDLTAEAPGSKPAGKGAPPFEGIDWTWGRVSGSERIAKIAADLGRNFRPEDPAASLPALASLDAALEGLSDPHWRAIKRQEVAALVAACAGLFVEANAAAPAVTPGKSLAVAVTALNRSAAAVKLRELRFVGPALAGGPPIVVAVGKPLARHEPNKIDRDVAIPASAPSSGPHWLAEPPLPGRFVLKGGSDGAPLYAAFAGAPENLAPVSVEVHVDIAGRQFVFSYPVRHKWGDPVAGERQRPLEIVPAVSVAPQVGSLLFSDGKEQTLSVRIRAAEANAKGAVRLETPPGYVVKPDRTPFALTNVGEEGEVQFTVQAPKGRSTPAGKLKVIAQLDGSTTTLAHQVGHINHPHIPMQLMLTPAEVHLVPIDLRREGKRIGYIAGAGDEVAQSLERAGYQVVFLDEVALSTAPLAGFDAIVTGVRAFNTNERLGHHLKRLLEYVKAGGTVVVQYNTNNRIAGLGGQIGPLPFDISRDRVTNEKAAVTFAMPNHPVLNFPNKITAGDFDGWVQERGLYFASNWDKGYEAPIEMADAGESPQRGSLIIARHGRGAFIYTGLAFFRQLPAGVPGAYRLFANLVGHGRARR
jgi:LmbE family N-acetylglucosaminyl deacetylase